MNFFKILLFYTVILAILGLVANFPLHRYAGNSVDTLTFDDDIIFPRGFDLRSGILPTVYRWPNGVVIYEVEDSDIGGGLNFEMILNIHMDIFRLKLGLYPCIKFIRRNSENPENDYVLIRRGKPGSGCYSAVGRQGGKQIVNLADHCASDGGFEHQMFHTLGFYHEHSRYDRDDYLQLNLNNVREEHHSNFNKQYSSHTSVFGVPYNYRSIMHYGAFAFAIDPNIPTIIPKMRAAAAVIGNTNITYLDIQKVSEMYSCEIFGPISDD